MRKLYPVPGLRHAAEESPEPAESHPGRTGQVFGTVLLALAGLATGLLIYTLMLLDQPLRAQIRIIDPDAYETVSLENIRLTEPGGVAAAWDQGGRTRVYVHPDFPIKKVKQKDLNVENILVFGIDSRKASQVVCRADALIMATIDRNQKSLKLTSIMRDIQVTIAGRNQPDRINAAYAYGGVGLLVNTLNEALDLDIQRFAMFDFWSAASLIDSLGGVRLEIHADEITYINMNLQEQINLVPNARHPALLSKSGLQQLDGLQAIAWARIRILDSDYRRTSRQRTVMTALIGKLEDASVPSLVTLINQGLSAFETNISNSEMIRFGIHALPLTGQIQEYQVPENGLYQVDPDPWMMIVNWKEQVAALHDFIWGEP